MDVMDKPRADAATAEQVASLPIPSLATLLAELQALSLVLPPTPRSDAEIEADFDNMPV